MNGVVPVLAPVVTRMEVAQVMPDESFLYHVTPLHYLPHILRDGALYAQSVLASQGIAPRMTAKRRDRMLGLADYVHFSLRPHTPLLSDKLAKGYPHALLVFDREGIMTLPQVALLPYNTKAWYTRAEFAPITDTLKIAEMLDLHERTARYRSLEVLVKYGLDLAGLTRIVFVADEEMAAVAILTRALGLDVGAPLVTDTGAFPGGSAYRPVTWNAVMAYFDECVRAGLLFPPPELPFD
jgi:hypothetical protein